MKSAKTPLDPVVKLGVGVLVGSFLLIGIGMFLSRPDRSIPPYSIGSQEGRFVAVHVPSYTSDPEIESLIRRFGKVGKDTRDFSQLKIRPTTPDHPQKRYYQMTLYIFSAPKWTSPEALMRYVHASESDPEVQTFKEEFEMEIRGGYILDSETQRGWLGSISKKRADLQGLPLEVLFDESLKN